ncbi:MAG: GTPase domain-containing protein [Candidatus Coatesbacteria bacterium]|nr:GTPase domain-containing protein [Candidatus Coatesbacteria bacterium]
MAVINYSSKEINTKIVYYGPGLGGKTTNVARIHEITREKIGGKLISFATDHERTLFFDFLPLNLATINGYNVRFHLYTVPGQTYFTASRRLILRNVDGIVFVADSQIDRLDANIGSMLDLEANLKEYNMLPTSVPFVIQYNKRDLLGAMNIEILQKELNWYSVPYFLSVASDGVNVFETFKFVAQEVIKHLRTSQS